MADHACDIKIKTGPRRYGRGRGIILTTTAAVPALPRAIERRWTTIRKPIGWAIGVVALFLLGRNEDWAAVGRQLQGLDITLTVAAIVLAVLVVYLKSLRWSILVRSAITAMGQEVVSPDRIGGIALIPVVLAGQLVNNGLPLRLGEIVRIEVLAARGVSRLAAASTVVVEKLCDGAALVIFAAVLSLVVPLPTWLNRNGIVLGLASAIILVAGALTIRRILRLIARRTDRVARVLAAVTTGLLALRAPLVAVPVLFWTLAAWIVGLLVNYAALSACGIVPTTGLVLLIIVAGYAGGLLPAPPGRVGVFQVICAQAAIAFGVDHTAAFVFANVEWVAVVVVPSALGGLSLLAGVVDRGDGQSTAGANR